MNLLHDSRIRGLIEKAQAQGFHLTEKSKRGAYKLIPPDKQYHAISISSTPSDCNMYWQLRRMMKRCGYKEET